jgi:uncharacterized protein YdcH (DUF465 family)
LKEVKAALTARRKSELDEKIRRRKEEARAVQQAAAAEIEELERQKLELEG